MPLDRTGAEADISQVADAQRYQISVDEQIAGFTAYREREHDGATERIFFHTEVDEKFGGRGLATILIEQALTDTRAHGKVIVGVCPLVAAFLKKHHEFDGDTRPVREETINWLQTAIGR
ncbi:GNAT family N-acetyltransferase [Gordonia polyisoprenivorans]|uniref:GNAT family N-acetyltransferase n=1 Tax=Gordonia polyisoprenivorans TaxID=84595 RepID=UPI00036768A2|nr:GNAT family N-acetyltransferase [Gordonia polyisoprenivorans]OZC31605.1 N-acetyltransferase [Gordonia polyisoprenivorans]